MAVRTREDEVGIGATLNVGTEQCLYAIVGIVGDLLKLVDGNKTWLVGLVEISEYLIKRNFGIRSRERYRAATGFREILQAEMVCCGSEEFKC